MLRLAVLALLAMALVFIEGPDVGLAKNLPTTISGGDMAHPVALTFQDEQAFWQRWPPLPQVSAPSAKLGTEYLVSSGYWNVPLRGNGYWPEVDVDEAIYYPAHGVVRMSWGNEDVVWLALDEGRDALLKRYITLAGQGFLPAAPTVLDVLIATIRSGEEIAVEVAGRPLDPGGPEARALWEELAAAAARTETLRYPEIDLPKALEDTGNMDVRFRLPEGRVLSLRYVQSLGYLVDLAPLDAANNFYNPVQVFEASPSLQRMLAQLTDAAGAGEGSSEGSAGSGGSISILPWVVGGVAGAVVVSFFATIAFARRRRATIAD
jgi:hypothetical protein